MTVITCDKLKADHKCAHVTLLAEVPWLHKGKMLLRMMSFGINLVSLKEKGHQF